MASAFDDREGDMVVRWGAALAAMVGLALGLSFQDGALRFVGAAEAAPLKIYTQWHGAAVPLDVVNGGEFDNFVHLAPAADVSGQLWTMTPADHGTFRLTTEFRGKDMCLDVVRVKGGGGMDGFLKLAPCGNHEGQYWTSADEGGWLRLRPQFWKFCLGEVNFATGPRFTPKAFDDWMNC
jgi:hypothetical protein